MFLGILGICYLAHAIDRTRKLCPCDKRVHVRTEKPGPCSILCSLDVRGNQVGSEILIRTFETQIHTSNEMEW